MPRLYLASQSPRRAALLQQIGVEFTQLPSTIDEQRVPAETAIDFVRRLAREKAAAGMALINAENDAQAAVVLGADTIVVKDQRIFGKPQNEREYTNMLKHLSASWHQVLTAVSLLRIEPTAGPGEAGVEHFSTLSNT
ncbi:MAG: Maf family protein, partial [Gammaproteobacteria bacterium]|nr:Maf family protein [Gammaproteobacteria bacterium]